jgi:hypothetical protein
MAAPVAPSAHSFFRSAMSSSVHSPRIDSLPVGYKGSHKWLQIARQVTVLDASGYAPNP